MKPISDALARTDARTCGDGCTYLRERLLVLAWRMQCTARTDAVHCEDGCSALQERLQCTASEMGKTGTEIASPMSPYIFRIVISWHDIVISWHDTIISCCVGFEA